MYVGGNPIQAKSEDGRLFVGKRASKQSSMLVNETPFRITNPFKILIWLDKTDKQF